MSVSIEDIRRMIASGESQTVEFKRDLSQRSEFASEMIAFANTDGGTILLGVEDDGTITGIKDIDRNLEALASLCRDNCRPSLYPQIEAVAIDGTTVVSITISRKLRTQPPYENNSGQCYVRVGSTKQLASQYKRAQLMERAGLYRFEEAPIPRSSLKDLRLDDFREYFEKVSRMTVADTGDTIENLLEQTRVAVRDESGELRPTVAGMLVFGAHPQSFLPGSRISVGQFEGSFAGEHAMRNIEEFIGNLPRMIEEVTRYVNGVTRPPFHLRGVVRVDGEALPLTVLREAIINAVVHRDYSIEGNQVRVLIFADAIQLRSPGGLTNSMTLDKIRGYNHETRNPLLAQFLRRLNIMEDFGRGIPAMIQAMKVFNHSEPHFEIDGNEFVVTVQLGARA